MAIGIPLSSLDVVVGISGVHYVLQGLRQIDRELDSTSKKRVTAAMQVPDLSAQFRQTAAGAVLGVSSIQSLTGALGDLQRAARVGIIDPSARAEAIETIRLAGEAQQFARAKSTEAVAAARAATAAEREYNKALRDQRDLQRDLDRATKAHAETERQITQLMARDYLNYVTTRTGAGIRAQNILNAPIGTAKTGGVSQAQKDRAAEYIDTTVEALENRRIDREKDLNVKLTAQLAERNRLNAAMVAMPSTGPLATAATSSRLYATALQNQATTAGLEAGRLATAAAAAKKFLADTAGFVSRGQQLAMISAAVGRFMGGLASGVLALGSFGLAAAGTAGHVGKLVLDFMRLPMIAGPLTGGLSLIASGFMAINKSILLVIGSLAGLSFKEILQEGMDFEEAMSNIKAVAQYTINATPLEGETPGAARTRALAAEMEELDYITLKLGADTIYSNTEIANLMETMLRGGVAVSALSESTVRAVADLASATKTATTDAASAVASTIKMFGASAEDIPHFADLIAAAVNTTNMSVADFTSAIRQLGPLTQALGIQFEDVVTLLAEVGAKGYFGEIAGTSLRNMLLYLSPRTKPAIAEMKEAGLWVGGSAPYTVVDEEAQANYQTRLANYEVQLANYQKAMADFQAGRRKTQPLMPTKPTAPKGKEVEGEKGHPIFYDEQGNLRPMQEIISLLQGATKGMSDEQLAEFSDRVFGKRSGSATLLLSKDDADQFQRTKELLNTIKASDVAAFRLENVKGKIELLSGSLKSLASVFFMNWLQAPIFAALNKLIPSVNAVLEWFGKAEEGGKSRGKMFFDALGKGLETGDLGGAWVDMMKQVPGLGANEWSARIRVIMRWLQLGRDAVITFGQAWRGVWGGAATKEINPVIRAIGIFATHWGNLWRNIGQLMAGQIDLKTFFSRIFGSFDRLWRELVAWVQTTWPDIQEVIKKAWGGLKDFGGWAWETLLKPALGELWEKIDTPQERENITKKIVGLFTGMGDSLAGEVGPIMSKFTGAVEAWFSNNENRENMLTSARALGSALGVAVGEGLSQLIKVTFNISGSNTAETAAVAVTDFLAYFLMNLAMQLPEFHTEVNSAVWGGLAGLFTQSANEMGKQSAETYRDSFGDAMKKVGAGIVAFMLQSYIDAIMQLRAFFAIAGQLFFNLIVGVLWHVVPVVSFIINGLINAANKVLLELTNAFRELMLLPRLDKLEHPIGNIDFSSLQNEWQTGLDKFISDLNKQTEDEMNQPPPQWMLDKLKGWRDFAGMGPTDEAQIVTGRQGPTGTEVFVPGTGYVPEKQAPPQKINPVTGTQAPEGYIWIYDPLQEQWVMITSKSLTTPRTNPITGQKAPEGYKWVLDSKDGSYDMLPVSFTQVSGATPDTSKIGAEGYVWIYDSAMKAWKLTPTSLVKPPPDPKITGGPGADAQESAGEYSPPPPVQPLTPPGNPDSPMFNAPPAGPPITINAQGLTDEMFLNKLGDSLEMRWQALNAGV